MKLIELDPRWFDEEGRHGQAITFRSPRCPLNEEFWITIPFANPIDGGTPYSNINSQFWQRSGDNFDNLTLTPSIELKLPAEQYWHGFITNGEVITV